MAFTRVQWTMEAVLVLIEKVKSNPVLWDTEHPQYKKNTHRRQLYAQIAAELQELFPNIAGISGGVVGKFLT